MVGASDSVAAANITLNTIVAEAFCQAADILEESADFETDCQALIRKLLMEHQRILFHGDGYSHEWVEEAKRRGLPVLPGMVDAIGALLTEKSTALFEKFRVYSRSELESRAEILYETYAKHINIEAKTMLHMVSKHYIPVTIRFTRELAETVNAMRLAMPGREPKVQLALLEQTTALLETVSALRDALEAKLDAIREMEDAAQIAGAFYHDVVPLMRQLRSGVDSLELLVSKEFWPVPTYGDLLFEV